MTPERYKEVGRRYCAAMELDPAQRAAYLVEACGGDEALQFAEHACKLCCNDANPF